MYPENVEQIVRQISQMTLLEVAELNECLKKRLNIADTPMMMAGPAAVAPAPAEVRHPYYLFVYMFAFNLLWSGVCLPEVFMECEKNDSATKFNLHSHSL